MKAIFITTANIFDKRGNGGDKASLEHLKMLKRALENKNVYECIYVSAQDYENLQDVKNEHTYLFPKLHTNLELLLAAMLGCRIYLPWHEKKLFEVIDEISPDVLFLDFSILGRVIRRKSGYKTIVFFHNIEADYTFNKMKNEGIKYYPAYLAAKKNDRWATRADRVICFNKRDSNRLYEEYGRKADLCMPITFEDRFNASELCVSTEKELLFLGSCFGPNQDGVEWFIQNVVPALEEITFIIVGKGFENYKESYERYKNVKVIGTVDNPAEYYYKYRAVVMPIRYGAGMKVKTAEAMMYGCHIFASDEALEGYDVEGVKGVERCNIADEYINSINSYFRQEHRCILEESVRKLFLDKYESNNLYRKFEQVIKDVLNE